MKWKIVFCEFSHENKKGVLLLEQEGQLQHQNFVNATKNVLFNSAPYKLKNTIDISYNPFNIDPEIKMENSSVGITNKINIFNIV